GDDPARRGRGEPATGSRRGVAAREHGRYRAEPQLRPIADQPGARDALAVDPRPVRRAQVAEVHAAVGLDIDRGVVARDAPVRQLDLRVGPAAYDVPPGPEVDRPAAQGSGGEAEMDHAAPQGGR